MNDTKVHLGLTNPKSPTNVGAVMRAAGCYQVDAVFYSGRRYDQAVKFHTDTQNATQDIPLTGIDNLLDSIPVGMKLVCVEFAEGATSLPIFDHPEKAFYIFGPEDGTISQKVIDKADAIVYVPTRGSMNLAASVNVLLYDRLAKSDLSHANDELIRASRDVNNRAHVRKVRRFKA